MNEQYAVGIIGGGGYTAGELIRLLIHHPAIVIKFVVSGSQAGKAVSEVHQDLVGETELIFTSEPQTADVLFLCMGHGKSKSWMEQHQPPAATLVVDLSTDYRLDEAWVYGLPELNRAQIEGHRRIANPGCFATAIQLGLLPWFAAGLGKDAWHINAITGSTGAGQHPSPTTHFSWRNNNISIYKAFRHQHLAEINRNLRQVSNGITPPALHFLPMRGNFTRGIYASLYTSTEQSADVLQALYADFYHQHPFVHINTSAPHLKQVVNTNKALVTIEKIDDQLLVISMIDNLLKGASGQAVQNMNIALGLAENLGLGLKSAAF